MPRRPSCPAWPALTPQPAFTQAAAHGLQCVPSGQTVSRWPTAASVRPSALFWILLRSAPPADCQNPSAGWIFTRRPNPPAHASRPSRTHASTARFVVRTATRPAPVAESNQAEQALCGRAPAQQRAHGKTEESIVAAMLKTSIRISLNRLRWMGAERVSLPNGRRKPKLSRFR